MTRLWASGRLARRRPDELPGPDLARPLRRARRGRVLAPPQIDAAVVELGREVAARFDDDLRARWSRPVTVRRRLPELHWKRYLANEHPALSRPEEVREEHILQFQAAIPNQSFSLNPDGSLDYGLTIAPIRASTLSGGAGFANAILGPSHNYERPTYTFPDGEAVGGEEIASIRAIAEDCTHEINWQNGDVAVIDNTRIMHGRRAIVDPERQLFIGMRVL